MSKHILITGGAGYIGSHTCLLLLQNGYKVIVYDNLSNSSRTSLERVEQITGQPITFFQGDIRQKKSLTKVFQCNTIDAVIHFAGLKSVGESVNNPLAYYENNVVGTFNLLEVMQKTSVNTLVFSSSATVYGDPQKLPIIESAPRSATNPYGRSKLIIEDILSDLFVTDSNWRIARLRYFNPVGAHNSGLIGESPCGVPNNLMPFISQVASGIREHLNVFGNDYLTPDGTGVRDYIHVMDLAQGHLAALNYLNTQSKGNILTVNLGTGLGISVLEMLVAFEKVSGKKIPYQVKNRRSGDIASCYADPSHAENMLGWKATRSLEEMCLDTWRWQTQNPHGY